MHFLCRIVERHLPAKIVFEDDDVMAFEDHPQAPNHTLIIPRKHITSLSNATTDDAAPVGHMFAVAAQLARERGLDAQGYRTVINTGPWGGQTVFHLHVHLLGGRVFRWPPGRH